MKRALILVFFLVAPPVWALDLARVYEMALASDPQLRAARSSRDSKAESRPQAIADMLPQLDLSATVSETDKTTYTSPPTEAGTCRGVILTCRVRSPSATRLTDRSSSPLFFKVTL